VADETTTEERTTKDRATDIATTARDEARDVAGEARSEASAVLSEAGNQARVLADEARTALRQQASDGASRAVVAVQQLADRLRALADGNAEQAGDLQRYARDIGDHLGSLAGRMQERGVDGLVDDVQRFARRRPAVFLAVAAGAGLAAGRLFRGARADSEPAAGTSTGNGHKPGASGAPVSSQPTAGAPTTALPSVPGTDEQRRATELSGLRPQPVTGAERTGPEDGSMPAPTPYRSAAGDAPGIWP
jgi:vacuolar-type H+-ATPase subunit H